MNLHQVVRGAIGAINPFVKANVFISVGSTMLPDGRRVPNYADPQPVMVQSQALQADELRQLDGVNLQGIKRALYLNGQLNGIVRADNKGGDLVVLADDTHWLVLVVIEAWPGWCKVAVIQQLAQPPAPDLTERILANGVHRVTTNGPARALVN